MTRTQIEREVREAIIQVFGPEQAAWQDVRLDKTAQARMVRTKSWAEARFRGDPIELVIEADAVAKETSAYYPEESK